VKKYKLLTPKEYLEDLKKESSRAKKRVWLQAMYYLPSKTTSELTELLTTAGKRSLDTRLQFDYITLMDTDPDVPFISKILLKDDTTNLPPQKRHKLKKQILHTLKKAGVKVNILNKPKGLNILLPLKGRNHIKLNIIDNIAYVGGINYGVVDFENRDFMVKIHDLNIVKELVKIYETVWNNQLNKDENIIINKEVSLWLDYGGFNKSTILENVISSLKKANKSILYTGQFPPDGAYLKELVKADKRGVKVSVLLSKKSHNEPVTRLLDYLSRKHMYFRGKDFKVKLDNKRVHAKVTLIDEETLIFGSHNYSKSGVLLGTSELTLKIKDRDLSLQALKYLGF